MMRSGPAQTDGQVPFVGRRTELDSLRQALEGAEHGGGRFVALAGESGMGKTRLLTRWSDELTASGRRVVWSQILEDPGAPPLFGWMLILRGCLSHYDNDALRDDVGSGVEDLALIVPELGDRLGVTPAPREGDSRAARVRLFDSVTRFLFAAAARNPLVLLFDNLHAADSATVALLQYLGSQVQGQRLLMVGAYRESAVDARHPLRPVLQTLARTPHFERLALGGLSIDDVASLVQARIGLHPPSTLVDSIHAQSGGNPLFVSEISEMLGQRLSGDEPPAAGFRFAVPDSLRSVIVARIDTLPRPVADLLAVAAVFGREFEVTALGRLSSTPVARVQRSLQHAEGASVVERLAPGRFRFQHALFREVVYGTLSSVQLPVLHGKAGEILEASNRGDGNHHVSELAHHFYQAAHAGYVEKAITYCRKSAKLALAKRAYDEAVVMFERALQTSDLLNAPDISIRFELRIELGKAQHYAGQLQMAAQTLLKAAILAHGQRWWRHLSTALFEFQLICQESGYRNIASVPLHREVLDNISPDEESLRVRTLASLARAFRSAGEPERAGQTIREAITLARASNDEQLLLDCLRKASWTLGRCPADLREGLQVSCEALALSRSLGAVDDTKDAIVDIVFQLADLGDISGMESRMHELETLAASGQHPHVVSLCSGFKASIAILKGDWEVAEAGARQALKEIQHHGALGGHGRFAFQMFTICKARGRLQPLAQLASRIMSAGGATRLWLPGQVLLLTELDRTEEARRMVRRIGDVSALGADDLRVLSFAYLAEACSKLNEKALCEQLFRELLPYRGLNTTLPGALMLGAVSGYLAILAQTLDRHEEARALFDEALDFNAAMGAAPALASTQVRFARLLAASDAESDLQRADRLISSAQRTAHRLDLQPVLALVERFKDGTDLRQLTRRETEVLTLVASGASNKEISSRLHISHSTVTTHMRSIFRKVDAGNRTEAADYARRTGLLDNTHDSETPGHT